MADMDNIELGCQEELVNCDAVFQGTTGDGRSTEDMDCELATCVATDESAVDVDLLNECLLCGLPLASGNTVNVERGLQNLKDCSDERGDGLRCFMELKTVLTVHVDCRRRYISKSYIDANKRRADVLQVPPAIPLLRSSVKEFDFKSNCLFCGEEYDCAAEQRKPVNRRRSFRQVLTENFQCTVTRVAGERDDELSRLVLHRIACLDLIAYECHYHNTCYSSFLTSRQTEKQRGYQPDLHHVAAFDKLCAYCEETDECQFTIGELLNKMTEFLPADYPSVTRPTLKKKLEKHFGNRIIITAVPGGNSVLTFTDGTSTILNESWYRNRKDTAKLERLRIVEAAASIIREDICSRMYDVNNYRSTDEMFTGATDDIPDSLKVFTESVVLTKKKGAIDMWKRKCTAIAHSILTATRPRSFLSSLQVGLAVHLHRRYSSRNLIDLLNSLGVCASYREATLYESSLLLGSKPNVRDDCLIQYIFDNADFNIRTLDGKDTFHCMGGLRCVTPGSCVSFDPSVKRLSNIPQACDIAELGKINILHYRQPQSSGLKTITIKDVSSHAETVESVTTFKLLDNLWMQGHSSTTLEDKHKVAWSGFMTRATAPRRDFKMSSVIPLPFINLPATDLDSIYTALMLAINESRLNHQNSCFVTFDQPLYAKAVEMVASSGDSGDLSSAIVRLGGFHMAMSFMGAIGSIMAGSGLEELWCTVYAKISVSHMLDGHAYARALRAHFLTQLALGIIIIQQSGDVDDVIRSSLDETYKDVLQGVITDDVQKSQMLYISNKITDVMTACASVSRTAKLWRQYYQQVELLRLFIAAERSGDFKLHLHCVAKMLPHFHAGGHMAYAKSGQLYLQQMTELSGKMIDDEYVKFVVDGFFTIRRSDKFWSGVWSDMTIEQVLMRSMKTVGGVTRGRGMTQSVLSRWILTMPVCSVISDNLETYCKTHLVTSEQHTDLRESRRRIDGRDVDRFLQWLKRAEPFSTERKELRSLSSGVVGDENIKCDTAVDCGHEAMDRMIGNNYFDVKLKRTDKVRSLATIAGVKIHDEVVPVSTMQLFNRIVCVVQSVEGLTDCFRYELATRPPALFDDLSMRKASKAALCTVLEKKVKCLESLPPETNTFVVDGGHLLHRVVWSIPSTYDALYKRYVAYVIAHYGLNVTVVFDGYTDVPCTKAAEHRRRTLKGSAANICVSSSAMVECKQSEFLCNPGNKAQLIDALTVVFTEAGISVHKAVSDADTLIVSTALSLAATRQSSSVAIVGEDTDLLVLLVSLAPCDTEIFLFKPHRARDNAGDKVYSSSQLQNALGEMSSLLLFVHAASGCDSTSAPYRKGKATVYKLVETDKNIRHTVSVFNKHCMTQDEIAAAGERFMLSLYNANNSVKTLDDHRYFVYNNTIAKQGINRDFDLAILPPTTGAARQHSLRVYHQIQQWLGVALPETEWGWKLVGSKDLFPTMTLQPPAPDSVLKLIYCNCRAGCSKVCRCRKTNLKCSAMCGQCRGVSCTNVDKTDIAWHIIGDDDDDILEDADREWNTDGIMYGGEEETVYEEQSVID